MHTGEKVFIAIDIGTTHAKAITVSVNAVVLYSSSVSYPVIETAAGMSEQDPEVLLKSVVKLLQQSVAANRQNNIQCICFSAAMHSLLPVDAQGSPLLNALTWADTRSSKQAADLLHHEHAQEIYHQTGTPIHAMSPLCKISWIRESLPDVFVQTHKFISIKEYIFFRLFGKYLVDYSIASATGLFNIHSLQWNALSLAAAGITAAHLSKPVPVTHMETTLTPAWRETWALQHIPFIIGANDGCLANLGCGAIHSNELALTIGTSGAVRLVTQQPYAAKLNTVFNYILTDHLYVTGGPTNNGGNIIQWLTQKLLFSDDADKNATDSIALATTITAGAEGLLFLPYLYGERAPVWDAHAKGAFIGLQHIHTRAHFARAVLEGICYGLYDIFTSLHTLTQEVDIIYASGGFTQSAFWLQMIADIFGMEVAVTDSPDASAMGAVFLGMYALGYLQEPQDAKAFTAIKEKYLPNQETHQLYRLQYETFRQLYARMQ